MREAEQSLASRNHRTREGRIGQGRRASGVFGFPLLLTFLALFRLLWKSSWKTSGNVFVAITMHGGKMRNPLALILSPNLPKMFV